MADEFADKVKAWRGDLTQREAAQLLGVSPRTLEGWESGNHEPSKLAMGELERRMAETKPGKEAA